MTPQGRCAAAIELLEAIENSTHPADRAAALFMRERRYVGAGDRRAILDQVYAAIRNRESLDWWIAKVTSGATPPSPRRRILAWLALAEGMRPKAIADIFSGDGYGPPQMTSEEQNLAERFYGKTLHPEDQPRRVQANCPDWIAPLLERRFGSRFLEEMLALNQEAPFDLRVNTIKLSRDNVMAELAKEGIEARPTRYSPWGLRISSRRPIADLDLYRKGVIEVQDEGSQIVSLLTDARPGKYVVDFCAGGGGKSLGLAVAMQNRGEIAALDVSSRLSQSAPRLKRAGTRIVKLHRLIPDDPWLKEHTGSADRVLLDSPCTRVGAWRRDPAGRFRLDQAELDRVTALQRQILTDAAKLVKPGGRLIYATCSLLREENEDQADWFASRQPEFKAVPVADIWPQVLNGTCPAEGPYLLLTPKRNETDGFFIAIFECVGVGQ